MQILNKTIDNKNTGCDSWSGLCEEKMEKREGKGRIGERKEITEGKREGKEGKERRNERIQGKTERRRKGRKTEEINYFMRTYFILNIVYTVLSCTFLFNLHYNSLLLDKKINAQSLCQASKYP